MGRHSPPRPLPVPRHDPTAVFANPSGRRWRRLRVVLLLLVAGLGGSAAIVVPQVVAAPALAGAPVPDGPTSLDVGEPPVIGEGPLVRVVRLLAVDGVTYGQEPFDEQVVAQLSPEEAEEAGEAQYALQRYGYDGAAGRTISLTFDDGPHPVYTPRLLDLLSEYGVPATFFVTGDQMVRYPGIMRRIVREGHALGNHSLTHSDVNTATAFREQAEIALTDRIMRVRTGRYASYFRLPYEGDDESSMRADAPGILRAQQLGYAVVSHDFDPQDWAYASGEETGDIPLPPLGTQEHITVLLHDSGGTDRSRTLAYVERLIGEARAAGYTFSSMPQVSADLRTRTGTVAATTWDYVAVHLVTVLTVWPSALRTWASVRPDGTLSVTPPPPDVLDRLAADDDVLVIPTVQNYADGEWQGEAMARLLADPVAAADHRRALVDQALTSGWDGIDVDYEGLPPMAGPSFTQFLAALRDDLHAHGLLLTVPVPARDEAATDALAYSYRLIGEVADQVRLMTYDHSWSGSPPGPVAPTAWVEDVVAYAVARVPREKLMLGMATYGYDWVGDRGSTVQAADAVALAEEVGAGPRWDATAGAWTFRYVDGDEEHTVWFEDARSLAAKQEVAVAAGLRGIAVWQLGGEDPQVWGTVGEATGRGAQS